MPTNVELEAMCDSRSKALALAIEVRDKTEDRWLDITRELPEHGKIVCVWDEYWGTSYEAQYLGDYGEGPSWEAACDREPEYRITHWMALPKTPRSLLSESGKPEVKK